MLSNFRQKKILETGSARDIGNNDYLTMEEAVLLAKVSRRTIYDWIREDRFPVTKAGKSVRIERDSFERWIWQKENGLAAEDVKETRAPGTEKG